MEPVAPRSLASTATATTTSRSPVHAEYEEMAGHAEQDLMLPGQQRDRITGLHYNRYRYYDPQLGAYISQDPIGLAGGLNLSVYALNSPLLWIDPLGLQRRGAVPVLLGGSGQVRVDNPKIPALLKQPGLDAVEIPPAPVASHS